MHCLRLTIAALLLCPMVAFAEHPTSRPSHDDRPDAPGSRPLDRLRHNLGNSIREIPTDEEWKECTAFMQKHAPHRSELFKSLQTADGPQRQRIQRFVFARYKSMQAIKQDEPEIYPLRLQSMEAEDALFSLLHDYRGATDSKKKDKLRADMQQQVAKLVDVWMRERQLRIQRLESALAKEKEQLSADQGKLDGIIEQRLGKIIAEGVGSGTGMHPFGEPGARGSREHDREREPEGNREKP